jgi:hypothetical protein
LTAIQVGQGEKKETQIIFDQRPTRCGLQLKWMLLLVVREFTLVTWNRNNLELNDLELDDIGIDVLQEEDDRSTRPRELLSPRRANAPYHSRTDSSLMVQQRVRAEGQRMRVIVLTLLPLTPPYLVQGKPLVSRRFKI